MKFKEILLILIIILFISILFVPRDNMTISISILASAVALGILYWYIRKK